VLLLSQSVLVQYYEEYTKIEQTFLDGYLKHVSSRHAQGIGNNIRWPYYSATAEDLKNLKASLKVLEEWNDDLDHLKAINDENLIVFGDGRVTLMPVGWFEGTQPNAAQSLVDIPRSVHLIPIASQWTLGIGR